MAKSKKIGGKTPKPVRQLGKHLSKNLIDNIDLSPPAGSSTGTALGTTVAMPQITGFGNMVQKGLPMKPRSVNGGLKGKPRSKSRKK